MLLDVLTMPKLESGLFVMTPVDVQLESIARNAVRMFEGEARSAGVDLEFRREGSCKRIGIGYVSLDLTRVFQILIVTSLYSYRLSGADKIEPNHQRNQVYST